MRWLFFLCSLCFFTACIETPDEGVQADSLPFFDLKAYLNQEIQRLAEHRMFTKTATINGQSDTKTFTGLDLEAELAIFKNADINRTAWLDKYGIDSTFSAAGTLQRITYKAIDTSLLTRIMEVQFSENQVSNIRIEQADYSTVASIEKQLEYAPRHGYHIVSRQKVVLAGENELELQVKY